MNFQVLQVNGSSITIEVRHFTGYTVVGQSASGKVAAKTVSQVAVTAPLEPLRERDFFNIRVYCVNTYDPASPEYQVSRRWQLMSVKGAAI